MGTVKSLRALMLAFASFVAASVWSARASALYLYIDMNNNPEEHAAFTKAAAGLKTPQQVVFIPEDDALGAARLKALTNARDKIWEAYTKKGCLAEVTCHPVLTGACGDIQKSLLASEDAVAQAPKVAMNEITLRSGLETLRFSNTEPITLAISGHFGGGTFTGNLGSFTVADIERIFTDFPELRNRITQLDLLGCYTNTFSQVESMWRHAFPNARVLVGFYGPSPRGETKMNLDFIADIVQNQSALQSVLTESDFATEIRRLDKYKDIHVALAVDDFFEQTDGPLIHISSERTVVTKCVADLPAVERDYFLQVLNGLQPIPANTSESRLRSYYTALRDHATCLDEPEFKSKIPNSPHPDTVIRLILYRNVVRNFRASHGADLANFDQLLQSMGVGPQLSIRQLKLEDRLALVAWKKAVELKLGTVADRNRVQAALNLLNNFSDILINLEPHCVPFDWVEPGANSRSECFQVTGLCS